MSASRGGLIKKPMNPGRYSWTQRGSELDGV